MEQTNYSNFQQYLLRGRANSMFQFPWQGGLRKLLRAGYNIFQAGKIWVVIILKFIKHTAVGARSHLKVGVRFENALSVGDLRVGVVGPVVSTVND